MANLAELNKLLETNAVQALKLVSNISGVDTSITGLMNKIQGINQQLYGLSVANTVVGKDFEQLKTQVTGVMRQFNFTADTVISMQKTLMTGFREPISNIEGFQNILARSRQVFGNSEAAAKAFIEELAKIDTINQNTVGLRDNFLELVQVLGKTEGLKTGTQAEIERGAALKELTKSQIEGKYLLGEIDRGQYLNYIKIMEGKNQEEEKLLRMTEKVQQSKQATSAMEAVFVSKGDSEALAEMLGTLNNFGSAVAASGIDALTGQLQKLQETRTNMGASEMGKQSQEIVKSIVEQAKDEAQIREKLTEAGIKDSEISKILKDNYELIAKKKEDEERTAQQIQAIQNKTLTTEQYRAIITDQLAQRTETLKRNYFIMKDTILASVDAMKTFSEISAYSGAKIDMSAMGLSPDKMIDNAQKAYDMAMERVAAIRQKVSAQQSAQAALDPKDVEKNVKEAEKIITMSQSIVDGFRKDGNQKAADDEQKRLDGMKQQLDTYRTSQKIEDLKFLTSTAESKNEANRQEAEANKISTDSAKLLAQTLSDAANNATIYHKINLEKLQAESAVMQSQIALMDSFAVGIGASAAAREKAARNLIEQAKQEEEIVKRLTEERNKALKAAAEADDPVKKATLESEAAKRAIEINKHLADRNNLNKQALDQLQKLREGYLDAITSMESSAGMFTEIVVDQNKNLGALIRTTEEVPRVLRTGAGSGGITQASQFGPGGLVGGFGPKSEEYSKHVITSMDDIQKLVQNLPEQIGQNLALAGRDRPERAGQIVEAATPGQAGTIVAPGGNPAVPGVNVEGPPSPSSMTASNQSGAAATAVASNIDMSNMVKEISTTIQRGVVDAVKKGMSAAVSELAKQTAPE